MHGHVTQLQQSWDQLHGATARLDGEALSQLQAAEVDSAVSLAAPPVLEDPLDVAVVPGGTLTLQTCGQCLHHLHTLRLSPLPSSSSLLVGNADFRALK